MFRIDFHKSSSYSLKKSFYIPRQLRCWGIIHKYAGRWISGV
ncbi:hypothetical protein X975_26286, partial [Stegodyphus mimosarum]